ncbi:hypothetical protein AAHZ94_13305 [Streptomyces sp. HSW2009]|uniref:hypothetical protein n=1 Tax=Streptomyces sp. HSW2009 TaxID=3142890 RepID=UPI0032ECBA2F
MSSALRVAALSGTLLAASLAVPAQAAAARAEPGPTAPGTSFACATAHHNNDGGSGKTTAKTARRSGPYRSCTNWGSVNRGVKLWYHCWTTGTVVDGKNHWTWARIEGTNKEGWFSAAYLDDGGAKKHC